MFSNVASIDPPGYLRVGPPGTKGKTVAVSVKPPNMHTVSVSAEPGPDTQYHASSLS